MYNTSLLYLSSVINLDILIYSYLRQEFLKNILEISGNDTRVNEV